jgi:CheY-like chemotaxis protein
MRALLIEENLMFSAMVEPALRRLGYDVRTVAPGPAAAAIDRDAPDLVLINLTSRNSAPDLIRSLRSLPGGGELAIVGYAGHVEREFLQAGREAGADLVVPNSALRTALPKVLEKLQRKRAGATEEWDEADD